MAGFTNLFNQPFYTGAGASADVPRFLPVAINGRAYLIDVRQYRRRTVPILRQSADQSPETGEASINNRALWRRHQTNWLGGAGQTYLDAVGSDRARFASSKGINPWEPFELSLQNQTALKLSSGSTEQHVLVVGQHLYVSQGAALKFTTNPTVGSPTFTTVTGGAAGTITSLATDGAYVYVTRSGQLIDRTAINGATMAAWSVAFRPTLAAVVNGRLIGALANRLAEIDAAGKVATDAGATANLLDYSHRNTSYAFTAITSAPAGIYVGGQAGDAGSGYGGVSEVHFVGISTTTAGALATPVSAAAIPVGETVKALDYYGGAIAIGTSKGLRVATVGANNALTFGPLIERGGGVSALHGQGQFLWFDMSNYDSSSTGLGRADLARFTQTLVPAYASDVMAGTSASVVQGSVLGIVSYSAKRYFVVSGMGLYGETTTPVAAATLTTSWMIWGTYERKLVTSVDMRHDALPATAAITAYTVFDDSETTQNLAGRSDTDGTLGPSQPFDAGRRAGEKIKLVLNFESGATSPKLRRWSVRSIVAPDRTDEILAPIIMHTAVTTPDDGAVVPFDPLAEFQFLKSLESSGQIISYQEGSSTYSAFIDGIEIRPERWMADMSFFESTLFVTLQTVTPFS